MASDETAPKRRTKAERLAEVHRLAMERFDDIYVNEREVRAQALIDRTFSTVRGGMWRGQFAVGEDATDEQGNPIDSGQPRLEIPKVAKALTRIYSEYRANRVTVDFKAKDADSNNRDADNLDGLFRADMQDTDGGGQDAFDNAYDEGTNGGMGAWRLRARYEDESDEANEHQRIDITPIYDADQTVWFDRSAKNYTKSDARYGFYLIPMTRDAFEHDYPDATPISFDKPCPFDFDWWTADDLWLAEYYVVEDKSVLRRTFERAATAEINGEPERNTYDDADLTAERDDGTTLEDELEATGWVQTKARRIKRQQVRKYLLSGAEVLDDEGVIAGQHIPIIPFYGKRWFINGTEWFKGHTRDSIDASRLYNMIVSDLAEAASGPADQTPILLPEQIAGYENVWAARRINRPAYLPLNPVLDNDGNIVATQPVGFLPVAQVQPNMAALLQVSASDIAELTGEADQVESVPSNTSDDAIALVHERSDMRTFIYKDNFRKSMEWCGAVYKGMVAELYVEDGREMTAIGKDGTKAPIKLNQLVATKDGGEYRKNDFTTGNYDVIVDVGPSSKTRAEATIKSLEKVAATAATIGANDLARASLGLIVMSMDGEGLEGLKASERRTGLAAGYVEPTEDEAKEIEAAKAAAGEQEDPNTIIARAQLMIAEAEMAKAKSGAIEAASKSITAEANAEKARADAAATLAGIDQKDRKQVLDEVKAATDSEREDERDQHARTMGAVDATMRVEQHDHSLREGTNGDAA
jgi:hypothetical protein